MQTGRPAGDFELLVEARIVDVDLEHEAVLLGFGERIRALLLDRVLGRQHEERVGQRMPHAADRHLPLLHGFQQRGLRLGRRAVDLIGQDRVREQGTFQEPPLARAGRSILFDDLRPGDVGRHQVGRELDATERQVQSPRQRADHQGLGQAGHAFQQAMPAAEQGNQQLFDHVLLADDHLGQLTRDLLAGHAQFTNRCRIQMTRVGCMAGHAGFLVLVVRWCGMVIVVPS